jgi:NMD protein affecting ribosome stability and mRNA decay
MGMPLGGKRTRLTAEKVNAIVHLFQEQKWTDTQIGEMVGVSYATVYKYRKRFGISTEIKRICRDCKVEFKTMNRRRIRCENCAKEKKYIYLAVRNIRHSFAELVESDARKALQILEEMQIEEGIEFTKLALDGIFEKKMNEKKNDPSGFSDR